MTECSANHGVLGQSLETALVCWGWSGEPDTSSAKGSLREKQRESKAPLTFNSGPSNTTPFSLAGHQGCSSRDRPGSLGLRSTWIRLRRRGSWVLDGAVESRVSHPFRGLGVSYGRRRGRGVD